MAMPRSSSPSPRLLRMAAVVLGSSLALAGCARQSPPPPSHAIVDVGVVTLHTRPVALETELPGRTAASLVADVRPQVSGIVKARLFREGSEVRAGQILYRIDSTVYQAAYDQARADLASAEANATAAKSKSGRYAELLKAQLVSTQDAIDVRAAYLQAAAAVEQKQAALESARINLDYTQVRAPISGRIDRSNVTPGALVTANQETALATIRALDPIYVDLVQSSAQLLRLRKLLARAGVTSGDATVRLLLEDGSQYALPGRLEFREVSVDQGTGSITLRARFPNPRGVLLPGMYVRAVLDEAVDKSALLAPQQGITRDSRGDAVAMIVDSANRVERRTVVTGRTIGSDWLITSGLDPGDRLIVQGLNKVNPGDRVVPISLDASAPQSAARSADGDLATAGAAARGENAGTAARHILPSLARGSPDP